MYAINYLTSKRVLSKRIGEIKSKTLYPDSALTRLFLSLSVEMIRPTQVIYAQAVPGETTKTVLVSVGQTNKQITASVMYIQAMVDPNIQSFKVTPGVSLYPHIAN